MTTAADSPFRATVRGLLRDRLLDAAAGVVETEGWSGVTMSRLAETVGVSRQTVYNEIGSKPALGQALVLRELERFLEVVRRALEAHDDAATAFEAAIGAALRRGAQSPLLTAVLSSAHGGGNELLPWLTTASEPLIERATSVVLEAVTQRHGDQPLDSERLGVLVETVVRLVLSHVVAPGHRPDRTAADVAWLVRAVLAGPS